MRLLAILLSALLISPAYAQTSTRAAPGIQVQEESDSVSVRYRKLKFQDDVLTNNSDGSVSIDTYGTISADLIPIPDDQRDLGSPSNIWHELRLNVAYIDSLAQTILPTDENVNLGSAAKPFNDIHILGTAYIETLDTESSAGSDTLDDVCSRGDSATTDENIVTTGTFSAAGITSTTTGTISGALSAGSLLIDSLSIDSNSISSAVNGTFSGTVQADDVTVTDDLTVTDAIIGYSATLSGALSAQSGTISTLTFGVGSITDSTGAISFGNENLTTTGKVNTGSLDAGNMSIIGSILTDSSGTISLDNENLTTTGTITTGQFTSNDDATISDTLTAGTLTDGTLSINAGNITSATNITTDDLTVSDDLTVADTAKIDGTMNITTGKIEDDDGEISFAGNNITIGGATTMGGTLSVIGDVTLRSVTTGNVKPETDIAYEIGGEDFRYARTNTQEIAFGSETYITFDGTFLIITVNGDEKIRYSATTIIETVIDETYSEEIIDDTHGEVLIY